MTIVDYVEALDRQLKQEDALATLETYVREHPEVLMEMRGSRSQDEVAELCDTNQCYISWLEHGVKYRVMGAKTVLRLMLTYLRNTEKEWTRLPTEPERRSKSTLRSRAKSRNACGTTRKRSLSQTKPPGEPTPPTESPR